MSKTPALAVGIDLGTTYSAIAWLDDFRRPQTLVNSEGDKLTPSAILFEVGETIVGKEAIKALGSEADNIALCAKRQMGARCFPQPLDGRQVPPEALQGLVLNKLRVDASRRIGPITEAVITVPAYFDEVRRQATMNAGYMAALDVLDIINEPTAAAVAFGFERSRGELSADGEQRMLVYDLGGGTFDVTVLEMEGAEFRALATDGDVMLGGRDWDARMIELIVERFIAQHDVDPRQSSNAMGRLWRECEDAKRTLTARQQTTVTCEYNGQVMRSELTRDEFEQHTADLLERTRFTTIQTLEASGLDWDDIDHLLLVGGSTRMPAVQDMLRQLSGKQPDSTVSPDEAVAHGAALHAGFLQDKRSGKTSQFHIRNVNSHSLGVVGSDPVTKSDRVAVLIPRNTPIPATAQRVFKTKTANQESILVRIVEGESPSPEDCVPLGECIVSPLPSELPAKTPIEVRFRYEEDGRLTVHVRIDGIDVTHEMQLTRVNSLAPADLDAWRIYVSNVPPPNSDAHSS